MVSSARKPGGQGGRQIKVVAIEDEKAGDGVATVKDLYIYQYAKKDVEQVESEKAISVECDRRPSVTVTERKEHGGELLWKEACDNRKKGDT